MITDQTIKKALREAPTSGKGAVELTDDGQRGAGRLKLIIRVTKKRLIAEWYAIWWDCGKPAKIKIGSYPTIPLAEARADFRANYEPLISKGERPAAPHAKKQRMGVTVKDLFQAYVDELKRLNKRSADRVEQILLTGGNAAAKALGEDKRAADITARDIRDYLYAIHARGKGAMAHATRSWLVSAFAHAMASENSYTQVAGTVDWGIKYNPARTVPAEKGVLRAGNRYLNQDELGHFWRWLETQDERSVAAQAARLIICTGQRVEEIMRIGEAMWDRHERLIDWDKTKNGMPHNVPVPALGVDIFDKMMPNEYGLFFPMRQAPEEPSLKSIGQLVDRYLRDHPEVPRFTPRDLRRTWKTLAGAAGITDKQLLDRIQNHAQQDVSTKHYFRYDQLKERRAAMDIWNDYLSRIINGTWKEEPKPPEQPAPEPKRPTQRLRLVPPTEEQLGLFDAA